MRPPTDENESEFLTIDLDGEDTTPGLIHEACWKILKAHFCNAPVPLSQLRNAVDVWHRAIPYEVRSLMKAYGGCEDSTQPISFQGNDLSSLVNLPEPSHSVARQQKERFKADIFFLQNSLKKCAS